jgi:hypothetical protein
MVFVIILVVLIKSINEEADINSKLPLANDVYKGILEIDQEPPPLNFCMLAENLFHK